MVIPLHLTVHVHVKSRRPIKTILLVIEVFDWQFLFDEQRRIGGTERWSVMWVTETPPGYHRL